MQDNDSDQGFTNEQAQSVIIPHNEFTVSCSASISKPKLKEHPPLKFCAIDRNPSQKQQIHRSLIYKQQRVCPPPKLLYPTLIKTKRIIIGQNISHTPLNKPNPANIVYERPRQTNTYGFLKSLPPDCFLAYPINQLLRSKVKGSVLLPKKAKAKQSQIQFDGHYQGGNLQCVAQVSTTAYDVYLKNDTNTNGHRMWFNFTVHNTTGVENVIRVNICNIKRDTRLIVQSQTIYIREITPQRPTDYYPHKTQILKPFSFTLTLPPSTKYQISLLPSYTYTDLLLDMEALRLHSAVLIQTLCYSVVGVAIPVLTISLTANPQRVCLISCRVHPGQTISSYILKGFLTRLLLQSEYLQSNMVVVVPMLNPDGVIFGHFRTNYLGDDMNRGFHNDNQIVYPEIVAFKSLGALLKTKYQDRFCLFIDLHGHSTEKGIFSYGPDCNDRTLVRLFPKIMNYKSEYFNYSNTNYILEEYKVNTARGYFLRELNVNSYTIEASYSLYIDGKNKCSSLTPQCYLRFGGELCESVKMYFKMGYGSYFDDEEMNLIRRFKKEMKKEEKVEGKSKSKAVDSDGEEGEDFTKQEKEEIYRRITESSTMRSIRVQRPTIVYPTITPKLFKVREEIELTHLKIMYQKKVMQKSPNRRYIHSIRGLDALRPIVRNINLR